jgi:hypothetical protein
MDVKPPQAARGQSSASIAFRLRLSLAGSSGLIGRVSNGLAAGQSFTSADQIAVKVDSAVAGGFSITATNNRHGDGAKGVGKDPGGRVHAEIRRGKKACSRSRRGQEESCQEARIRNNIDLITISSPSRLAAHRLQPIDHAARQT